MENKKNNRRIGADKERVARWFLREKGYEIIEENYRCSRGEVDVIAQKDGYIVFVEVKYRASTAKGYPGAAVNAMKQQKISKAAKQYLYSKCAQDMPCRFDVVEILGNQIRIIENAFDYVGGNRYGS